MYDLLDPSSAGLHLRENIKKGVFVDGLAERDITTAKDAYNVLQSGWLNRRVASTSMNRESSRSHAVFTVTLESKVYFYSPALPYTYTHKGILTHFHIYTQTLVM